jgi:glycosyltransferase involved in cell wall biosynthesis
MSRGPIPEPARRRVLMLAYFFPPLGGAGVQRTLKYARYLPEHGWDATVVTTASRSYPAVDESLLAEVSAGGVRVVRAAEPALYACALAKLASVFDLLGLDAGLQLTRWPDGMLGWAPGALRAVLREVRRARPDVLYSTSAPYTAHLVALVAHRLTGVPWVADFRDEWSQNPYVHDVPRVVAALDRRAERAITAHASRVTVAADYFQIAGVKPADLVTITNGVDDADLPAPRPDTGPPGPGDRLRLSFVGTLYGPQDARPVLAALGRLLESGRLDPERLELRIVGNVWIEDPTALARVPVSKTGYVDHRRALEEMVAADALLLYVSQHSLAPGGKLWEYLASERPVLCVTRLDNLAARLVREWGAGVCAAPDDPDGIEDAILELWRRWEAGELSGPTGARALTLERHSRRALAGRLAGVLDGVIGS